MDNFFKTIAVILIFIVIHLIPIAILAYFIAFFLKLI